MKSAVCLTIIISVLLIALVGCEQVAALPSGTVLASPAVSSGSAMKSLKDGIYTITCDRDGEGYYVKGSLTITNGKIVAAEWAIYDGNRADKVFDKDYEVVFAGNDGYVQQCRDNLMGMAGYKDKLIETQDVDAVDAVSGATWSYIKFKEFIMEAIKQATSN